MKALSIALGLVFVLGWPLAHSQPIDGLSIKIDDSVEAVRSALKTDQLPVDMQSAVQKGASVLKLMDQGIWVFFDRQGRTYLIRLEQPFAGRVGGAKIGSTRGQLIETLGEPMRVLGGMATQPGQADPHVYRVGNQMSARFDFDREDQVARIFISK